MGQLPDGHAIFCSPHRSWQLKLRICGTGFSSVGYNFRSYGSYCGDGVSYGGSSCLVIEDLQHIVSSCQGLFSDSVTEFTELDPILKLHVDDIWSDIWVNEIIQHLHIVFDTIDDFLDS